MFFFISYTSPQIRTILCKQKKHKISDTPQETLDIQFKPCAMYEPGPGGEHVNFSILKSGEDLNIGKAALWLMKKLESAKIVKKKEWEFSF